jgi:hypothetical protein
MAENVKTLMGKTRANTKTCLSVAIANVKTAMGVDNTGGGGGGFALVAQTLKATLSGSGGTTDAIDTTGANLIVIGVSAYSHADAPTDSKSNTWTALTLYNSGTGYVRLFYCVGGTVGTGHTFTSVADYSVITVLAFSGSHASPYHSENGATSGAQPGAVVPAVNGSLIVTAIVDAGGTTGVPSADGSFTSYGQGGNGGVMGGIAWYVQPTAASINPTWSATTSTNKRMAIADFAPA